MRIAQVVHSLEIGGLERVALDLAIAARSAGHESILISVSRDGPLGAEAESVGIPVARFGKGPGFSLRTVAGIAHCLSANRIDVVHTHNSLIHHYGALAARIARIPAVVNTEHGLGGSVINPRQHRIFRAVVPITDAIVFVSAQTRDSLCATHRLPLKKAHVVLNGIRFDRFDHYRAQPGARRPAVRFGTVGRMVPIKDHATLLRAFQLLLGRLPDAELRILGYGPLEEATRALARDLGIAGRVTFKNGGSSVPEFLAQLDTFVLSSESEGLPVSVLEAMAAGLPIVSTRVGGVPEAAPEDRVAWYCPPRSPELLAEAMYCAGSASNLARIGREAREIVHREFSVETMFQRYQCLYRELL